MALEEKLRGRVKTLGRKFPALVGGSVLLAFAAKTLNDEYLRKPESQGGPRLTDQPSQSGEGNGGTRVEPKPGADEQNRFRWPWDDDDDLTGGAASGDGAYGLGGVDSDFDAMPFVYGGATVLLAGLVVLGVSAILRGGATRHAPAY